MAVFDVKVTGYEAIQADNADEAIEKFEHMLLEGYKVLDLRWKIISTRNLEEEE